MLTFGHLVGQGAALFMNNVRAVRELSAQRELKLALVKLVLFNRLPGHRVFFLARFDVLEFEPGERQRWEYRTERFRVTYSFTPLTCSSSVTTK